MSPDTYGEVLARNIRAARSRVGIGQANVAARMQALGFTQWVPQTVSKSERNNRRLLAEEIAGLAAALGTTIRGLLTPLDEDKAVRLQPDGPAVAVSTVQMSVTGRNDGAVRWDGDTPVFSEGVRAWWGGREDDPALKREG